MTSARIAGAGLAVRYAAARGKLAEGRGLSDAYGPSDLTSREEWAYRHQWYASEFAYLLARLDAIPEAGGTLLDHTAVLWCSELGQGASHSHDDVPFVIAGGAGLGIPGGRYLTYAGKHHNDLLASLLTAVGVTTELFGDPDYATGLLPGLLA